MTVKEKFIELLKAKGLAGEDADAAMLAALPSVRWSDNGREYPPQFYEDKLPEILKADKELKAAKLKAQQKAAEADKARIEAEAKAKAEAEKANQ